MKVVELWKVFLNKKRDFLLYLCFIFWKRSKKNQALKCSKCGEKHDELPAIAFSSPDYYEFLSESDKRDIADLSDDFCIIEYEDQTDRFIRTTLTLQVVDACEDLDYGIWVSVSKKTFEEYKTEFKQNSEGKSYFGRICNEIPEYPESTLGLHINVETRANGLRPEIIPHRSNHQL
ncbi:MAG: DUF2199 domain-containing protein, partial [Bacteroidota bacterium]